MENNFSVDPNDGQPSRPRWGRWVLYGFLGLGVFFLLVSAARLISSIGVRKALVETQSTIVGFDERDFPILEFSVDGQTYRVHSDYMSSDMQMGQHIRLLYDPADPSAAQTGKGAFVDAIVFAVFGFVFGGIPLLILRSMKKADQRREDEKAQALYEGKPVETEAPDSIFLIIFRNVFFWIGLLLLGLAVLFLILKIADPETHSFITVLVLGFIGATFTAIGSFIRKIFR